MTGVPSSSPMSWSSSLVQALSPAPQAELGERYDGRGESGTPPTADDVAFGHDVDEPDEWSRHDEEELT